MQLRLALVAGLLAVRLLAQSQDDEPSAWELYQRGRAAEKAGHMAEAYLMYAEAAAKDPRNKRYWERTQAVQSRAAMESTPQPNFPKVADLDKEIGELSESQDSHFDLPSPEDLKAANEPLPPTHLDAQPGNHELDFTGDFKKLFTSVAHVYGLECIFDSDYQAGTSFRFHLRDVDYRDALHALEAATGSFVVPITRKIFLVAKDTTQKRTEIEPTVTVAVRFPDIFTQQEFEQCTQAVRQAIGLEKVALDASEHMVVMRDRISKVVYAQALFNQLMHPKAQVEIDLRFIEVSLNDSITYGLNFPNMFSLTALTNFMNNIPAALPTGIQGLLSFGGGASLFGLGIAGPSLVANLSKSTSKLMLASTLRTDSGQKATLHIGDKYPVMTGGYGTSTTTPQQGTLTVPPSFTFQDLGLTLTATPVVHDTESVSLDVDAQYQVLTGASLNGIPVISNRALKNITRLQFGEWAVIAGLLTTNDARTLSGLAGLNRIPFLGPLTNTHTKEVDRDEVIILLRPVLLNTPANAETTRQFYTGTENRPLTPL